MFFIIPLAFDRANAFSFPFVENSLKTLKICLYPLASALTAAASALHLVSDLDLTFGHCSFIN